MPERAPSPAESSRRGAVSANAALYLVGQAAQRGLPFLVAAVYASRGEFAAVGLYAILMTAVGTAAVVFSLNLATAVQLAVAQGEQGEMTPPARSLGAGVALVSGIAALVTAAVVLGDGARVVSGWLGVELAVWELALIVWSAPVMAVSLGVLAAARGRGSAGLILWTSILQLVVTGAVVLAGEFVWDLPASRVVVLSIAAFSVAGCAPVLRWRDLGLAGWSRSGRLHRGLRYAAPYVPHVLATRLNSQLDKWLVVGYVGLAQAGVYSTIFMLGQVSTMVLQPVTDALFPQWVRRSGRTRPDEVGALAWMFAAVATGVGLALFVGTEAVAAVFSLQLTGAHLAVFAILIVGFQFNSAYLSYHLEVSRTEQSRAVAKSSFASVALEALLLFVLVPRLGILGAAISFASGAFLKQLLLLWFLVGRDALVRVAASLLSLQVIWGTAAIAAGMRGLLATGLVYAIWLVLGGALVLLMWKTKDSIPAGGETSRPPPGPELLAGG